MDKIINAILGNEKRVAKLRTLNGRQLRDKIQNFVVSECQAQKIKLSQNDIFKASAEIEVALERIGGGL